MIARAELRAEVCRLIYGQLVPESELSDRDDLFEAGLDSMAILKLVAFLEKKRGRELPDGAVSSARFRTLAAIAELLATP